MNFQCVRCNGQFRVTRTCAPGHKQDAFREVMNCPYQQFLAHVLRRATTDKFVSLVPFQRVSAEICDEMRLQLQSHADRLGRIYHFVLSHGLDEAAMGPLSFIKDHILGFVSDREDPGEVLEQLSGHLVHIDCVAIQIGALGARFLVVVEGDRLCAASLANLEAAVKGIGEIILQMQGVWKLKFAGLKLGKGVGLDATGTVAFAFADPAKLEGLRKGMQQMSMGTPLGDKFKKAIRAMILNPLLFGHKGNLNVSPLTIRLFDRTVEIPGFVRSWTSKVGMVDRLYFGFTPEDLLPPAP